MVYDTAPLPVFVNDKLPTLLLFVKLKPVDDVVVNELPVMMSVPIAFSEIDPVAALNVTEFPAPAAIAPLSVMPALLDNVTAPVPLCVILFTPKLLAASTKLITPAPLLLAV